MSTLICYLVLGQAKDFHVDFEGESVILNNFLLTSVTASGTCAWSTPEWKGIFIQVMCMDPSAHVQKKQALEFQHLSDILREMSSRMERVR